MKSRVTLTGGQWREIEYDDHDLSGPFLIFHRDGKNVLTVTLAHLVAIEPITDHARPQEPTQARLRV